MKEELRKMVADAEMMGCTLLLEQRINLVEYEEDGKMKTSNLFDYNDPTCLKKIRSHLDRISNNLREKWEPEFCRNIIPALQPLNWSIEFDYACVNVTDEYGNVCFYMYSGDGIWALSEDISDHLLAKHAESDEKANAQEEQSDPNKACEPQEKAEDQKPGTQEVLKYLAEVCKSPEKAKAQESDIDGKPIALLYGMPVWFAGMQIIDFDDLVQESKARGCTSKHKCQGCGNHNCRQDHQLVESIWQNLSPDEREKLLSALSPEQRAEVEQCLNRK